MAIYNYKQFKILIDPDSKRTQGLRVGDIVRRQYFDYPNLIYSLMIVTDTGIDVIGNKDSHYFTGALIDGDEPKSGELLDFVRMSSLFDNDRTGALYLTASDDSSPYMDVIDGLGNERSLVYPIMAGGAVDVFDTTKYSCTGTAYMHVEYKKSDMDVYRILRLTRNDLIFNTAIPVGIQQPVSDKIERGERILISYKVRGSKEGGTSVQFGNYLNGFSVSEAKYDVEIGKEWSYKLHAVNIGANVKSITGLEINLYDYLKNSGDWVEIAELNVIKQADIATFGDSTKTRIGKIQGIVDPVFGVLDGYGAYFQNVYATKNINIAGTLTAGDENGFGSTFYVGKIHKNVMLNSIAQTFHVATDGQHISDSSPAGIGQCWTVGSILSSKYNLLLKVQTNTWKKEHKEKRYCFSIWAKSKELAVLKVYQDGQYIQDLEIDSDDWKRYSFSFFINDSKAGDLTVKLETDKSGVKFSAPQLESGKSASQYQPTDGTLSEVEDYGAWFSKGGIGGTIQNPLLKLNNDGSISSRDGSFVINPDGTGHFAGGRFKWNKDTITLQDVTIKWESLDQEAKDQLKPKSVKLSGTNMFCYKENVGVYSVEPDSIMIQAVEVNFNGQSRKWEYCSSDSSWYNLASTGLTCELLPTGTYWENRNVLTIKYTANYKDEKYIELFTVFKQYDGESNYHMYIESLDGIIFKNEKIATILKAHIYKGTENITSQFEEANFKWTRTSDKPEADKVWNSKGITGSVIQFIDTDGCGRAVFDCQVYQNR